MTNKEKYREVFGKDPDIGYCPTSYCKNCPVHEPTVLCNNERSVAWWNSEYRKSNRKTTNREKYRDVFGFYPDCSEKRNRNNLWWYDEYKGEQE